MKGYYKDDEKTRETIDADGWLQTGDIGIITPQGSIYISLWVNDRHIGAD
jgi:long-subunit acyl-CoA synthetase (AMP-forming)